VNHGADGNHHQQASHDDTEPHADIGQRHGVEIHDLPPAVDGKPPLSIVPLNTMHCFSPVKVGEVND
jgi:hypothetical protein